MDRRAVAKCAGILASLGTILSIGCDAQRARPVAPWSKVSFRAGADVPENNSARGSTLCSAPRIADDATSEVDHPPLVENVHVVGFEEDEAAAAGKGAATAGQAVTPEGMIRTGFESQLKFATPGTRQQSSEPLRMRLIDAGTEIRFATPKPAPKLAKPLVPETIAPAGSAAADKIASGESGPANSDATAKSDAAPKSDPVANGDAPGKTDPVVNSDATAKSDRRAKSDAPANVAPLAKIDPPAEGNTSAERSAPIPIASSPSIGTSPAPSVTPPTAASPPTGAFNSNQCNQWQWIDSRLVGP